MWSGHTVLCKTRLILKGSRCFIICNCMYHFHSITRIFEFKICGTINPPPVKWCYPVASDKKKSAGLLNFFVITCHKVRQVWCWLCMLSHHNLYAYITSSLKTKSSPIHLGGSWIFLPVFHHKVDNFYTSDGVSRQLTRIGGRLRPVVVASCDFYIVCRSFAWN